MIETLFGLARLGHTDAKGVPHPSQLALFAREFSDAIILRSPEMIAAFIMVCLLILSLIHI